MKISVPVALGITGGVLVAAVSGLVLERPAEAEGKLAPSVEITLPARSSFAPTASTDSSPESPATVTPRDEVASPVTSEVSALPPAAVPAPSLASPSASRATVAAGIPSSSLAPVQGAVTASRLGTPPESRESSFTPVNPQAPGNSLAFQGMRVAVAAASPSDDGAGTALAVDVTPEEDSAGEDPASGNSQSTPAGLAGAAETDSTSAGQGASAPLPSPSAVPNEGSYQPGLSQEEQLFRMKWGWAAYDAARREAARAAAETR